METKPSEEESAAPWGADDAAAEAPREVFQAQISGISFDLTQEALESSLAEAGLPDVKVNLLLRPQSSSRAGQNKGRAFLEVGSKEEMDKVMALAGTMIDSRPVYISRLELPLEETKAVTVRSMRGMTEEDIQEVMQREISAIPRSVRIREQQERSTCVAFCRFDSAELAQKATTLDGANIMGRWLDVTLAPTFVRTFQEDPDGLDRLVPFAEMPTEGAIIMAKGLPFDLSVEDLRLFFQQSGIPEDSILQMRMPMHKADRNTGIAYIHAATEHVEKFLNLKGSYINERWIDIGVWVDRSKMAPGGQGTSIADSRPTVVKELRENFPDLPVVEVGSIPFDKTEADFKSFLEEQGVPLAAVSSMVMPLFRQTPNNMGTAWLVINEEEAYNRVMELSGTVFHERWLTFSDA